MFFSSPDIIFPAVYCRYLTESYHIRINICRRIDAYYRVTAWEFSQVLLHVCLCIHIHVHCSREFIESYRYTKFQNFNISTNKIQVLVFIIFPLPVCNREFIDLSKCELLTRNQVPIDSVFEGNFSILIFVSVNFNYRSINFSRKPNDGFSIFGPLIDSPLYEL